MLLCTSLLCTVPVFDCAYFCQGNLFLWQQKWLSLWLTGASWVWRLSCTRAASTSRCLQRPSLLMVEMELITGNGNVTIEQNQFILKEKRRKVRHPFWCQKFNLDEDQWRLKAVGCRCLHIQSIRFYKIKQARVNPIHTSVDAPIKQ